MESIISTFHIDWKIIVAQAVNFGIVFLVLYLFALKPLTKLMTDRALTIEKGLHDAKANAEILKSTEKEYEMALVKAKKEASDIFQQAKKEAETKKTEMIEKAQSEVKGIIESGKKSLETEKIKMVEEAKKEIVSLTMLATEKLLKSKQDINNL